MGAHHEYSRTLLNFHLLSGGPFLKQLYQRAQRPLLP